MIIKRKIGSMIEDNKNEFRDDEFEILFEEPSQKIQTQDSINSDGDEYKDVFLYI